MPSDFATGIRMVVDILCSSPLPASVNAVIDNRIYTVRLELTVETRKLSWDCRLSFRRPNIRFRRADAPSSCNIFAS